jgi:hypothetical protein
LVKLLVVTNQQEEERASFPTPIYEFKVAQDLAQGGHVGTVSVGGDGGEHHHYYELVEVDGEAKEGNDHHSNASSPGLLSGRGEEGSY